MSRPLSRRSISPELLRSNSTPLRAKSGTLRAALVCHPKCQNSDIKAVDHDTGTSTVTLVFC